MDAAVNVKRTALLACSRHGECRHGVLRSTRYWVHEMLLSRSSPQEVKGMAARGPVGAPTTPPILYHETHFATPTEAIFIIG
jgi:hypothetical protein